MVAVVIHQDCPESCSTAVISTAQTAQFLHQAENLKNFTLQVVVGV